VKTSMLQDMERGRPLETASIVAASLEVADRAQVPIPIVRAMAGLILLKERIGAR
jgi:2-dehydropantoate 2-reductase